MQKGSERKGYRIILFFVMMIVVSYNITASSVAGVFKVENVLTIVNLGLYEDSESACNEIMEHAMDFDGLYLSIDIDVLDPAYAPGTGYLEPGGMTTREMIYFLHRLKMMKNLARSDIVEINPKKDVNNMTSKLGAKLIAELM